MIRRTIAIGLVGILAVFSLTTSGYVPIAHNIKPSQTAKRPFCGMQYVPPADYETVRSLGLNVTLRGLPHDGSTEGWLNVLDQAQAYGFTVIASLWPPGWTWDDDTGWHIDNQGRQFLQVVADHPAVMAVYMLHEPYWQGCPGCGWTTAEQQELYQAIKAIADVPLYSEITDIVFWAEQGDETTLTDGVCDYCATWYYPFLDDGSYQREAFISRLDGDIAAIQELAPSSKLVWLMQVFASDEFHKRMPDAEEIRDASNIITERQKDLAGVFWYVWEFDQTYDDFLSNHPELFPVVRNAAFCQAPVTMYLPLVLSERK